MAGYIPVGVNIQSIELLLIAMKVSNPSLIVHSKHVLSNHTDTFQLPKNAKAVSSLLA